MGSVALLLKGLEMDFEKFKKEIDEAFEKSNAENEKKVEQIKALLDEIGETCDKYGTNFELDLFGLDIGYVSKKFRENLRKLDDDQFDQIYDEYFVRLPGDQVHGWPEFWSSSSLYC